MKPNLSPSKSSQKGQRRSKRQSTLNLKSDSVTSNEHKASSNHDIDIKRSSQVHKHSEQIYQKIKNKENSSDTRLVPKIDQKKIHNRIINSTGKDKSKKSEPLKTQIPLIRKGIRMPNKELQQRKFYLEGQHGVSFSNSSSSLARVRSNAQEQDNLLINRRRFWEKQVQLRQQYLRRVSQDYEQTMLSCQEELRRAERAVEEADIEMKKADIEVKEAEKKFQKAIAEQRPADNLKFLLQKKCQRLQAWSQIRRKQSEVRAQIRQKQSKAMAAYQQAKAALFQAQNKLWG